MIYSEIFEVCLVICELWIPDELQLPCRNWRRVFRPRKHQQALLPTDELLCSNIQNNCSRWDVISTSYRASNK